MATVLQITATSSSSSMSMGIRSSSLSSSSSSSSFNGGLTTPRSTVNLSSLGVGTTTNSRLVVGLSLSNRSSSFRGLVVKAAAAVSAPKYTSLKPLGDRVLVKVKKAEEKTAGGIVIPTSAQTKPQGGEVVAVGVGKAIGEKKVDISVKTGAKVLYSKYAGTEVEFDGTNHLILKEDDIVGILENDDVKDLKPLNDRVLIKVAEVEEITAGGLMLTEASKQKPSIGTVVAIGPGPLDEEGNRKGLTVTTGTTVLYSKYAGSEYKAGDGSDYIVIRESDVMAVLS